MRCFSVRLIHATAVGLFSTRPPRGVLFELSPEDAVTAIREHYGSRWVAGVDVDAITLTNVKAVYLPFYLCHGTLRGDAHIHIRIKEGSSIHDTHRTVPVHTTFTESTMQVYAGYQYSRRRVMQALIAPDNALHAKPTSMMSSGATTNLFEMHAQTLVKEVSDRIMSEVHEELRRSRRLVDMSGSTLRVDVSGCVCTLDWVVPCFLPCFVVDAVVDGEKYHVYVAGRQGTVAGPYWLNAITVARMGGLVTCGVAVVLSPVKVLAPLVAIVAYYVTFFAARRWPTIRRDLNRRMRERRRASNAAYQTEDSRQEDDPGAHARAAAAGDAKGYYQLLGLTGREPLDEVRQAYRRQVRKHHPDMGGSTERMAQLNEAYSAIRDPKKRAEYDALC